MASKEVKNDSTAAKEDEFFDFSNLTAEQLAEEEERLKKQSIALANRRKEIANRSYIEIEQAMTKAGITPAQMIAYLQPKAALDGVDIRWTYTDAKGKPKVFDYWAEKRGANSIKIALEEKKISKEEALKFAITEQGRKLIEEWSKAK